MPFPYTGDIHYDTNELLDRCHELQIPVHIDSAWITASKDIEFDYDHPAIDDQPILVDILFNYINENFK